MCCDRKVESLQGIGMDVKILLRRVTEVEKSGIPGELRCKLLDNGLLEFVMRPW